LDVSAQRQMALVTLRTVLAKGRPRLWRAAGAATKEHIKAGLLAALGAWFGWKQIPSIILLASAVGATVGILLIVSRQHRREAPIPFGPYLAGAGLLALYFGKPLGAFFGIA
jgi:leader peptidase (prepilin peptidase)/N-methyltransferase